MCLQTRQIEPLIAQEDITVYKCLDEWGRSPSMEYNYNLGELYETEIKESWDWTAADDHTMVYMNDTDPVKFFEEFKNIGAGFHSIETIERAKIFNRFQSNDIYECTIPKGSEYYKDETGLVVSNKIIINKQYEAQESLRLSEETSS